MPCPVGRERVPLKVLRLIRSSQAEKEKRKGDRKFRRYKVLLTLPCSWTEGHFRQSPRCSSAPPFVKKAGGNLMSGGCLLHEWPPTGCLAVFAALHKAITSPRRRRRSCVIEYRCPESTVLLCVKLGAVFPFAPVSPPTLAPPTCLLPLLYTHSCMERLQ